VEESAILHSDLREEALVISPIPSFSLYRRSRRYSGSGCVKFFFSKGAPISFSRVYYPPLRDLALQVHLIYRDALSYLTLGKPDPSVPRMASLHHTSIKPPPFRLSISLSSRPDPARILPKHLSSYGRGFFPAACLRRTAPASSTKSEEGLRTPPFTSRSLGACACLEL